MKSNGKIFICEYKREYGEKLDNCPRYSPKKIVSMLNTAGFRNIKICDVHKNLIMVIAQKSKNKGDDSDYGGGFEKPPNLTSLKLFVVDK